jgi:hypothetical protein
MGNSSSSKVLNQNNTLIMNDTDINIINKNITNQVANTVINNAKKCSANINQLQQVKFKNITVSGDFNLNSNQSQQAVMTFGCVNSSQTRSDIANNMMQEMMNSLEQQNSSDVLMKMDAAAQSSQKNGFLSTAMGNSTSSNSSNIVNFTQRNTVHENLQNIIEQSIQNNFTTNNISDCIAQVNNNQLVDAQNIIIGGNANIAIKQDQAATLFAECIQSDDVGSKITNSIKNAIGVKSETTNKTVAKADMKATSESSQVNSGFDPFASLGSCFASVGGPIIGCIICCVLCCVIFLAIKVVPKLFGSKSDTDANDTTKGDVNDTTKGDVNDTTKGNVNDTINGYDNTAKENDNMANDNETDKQSGGFLYNLFTDTFSETFNVLSDQYFNNYQ